MLLIIPNFFDSFDWSKWEFCDHIERAFETFYTVMWGICMKFILNGGLFVLPSVLLIAFLNLKLRDLVYFKGHISFTYIFWEVRSEICL